MFCRYRYKGSLFVLRELFQVVILTVSLLAKEEEKIDNALIKSSSHRYLLEFLFCVNNLSFKESNYCHCDILLCYLISDLFHVDTLLMHVTTC